MDTSPVQPISTTLWYEALAQPIGLVIEVEDLEKARQKLYRLRVEARDPDLEVLSIVASPTHPRQLWIVRSK